MDPIVLYLPAEIDSERLPAVLAAGHVCALEAPRRVHCRYVDSADRRLLAAGLVLVGDETGWRLTALRTDEVVASCSAAPGDPPRTVDEFPPAGDLRRRLRELLGSRALVDLLAVASEVRPWRLLAAGGEVVLRADLCRLVIEGSTGGAPLRLVTLQAASGREDIAATVCAGAEARGLTRIPGAKTGFLLSAAGLRPDPSAGGFRVELAPDSTAREAAVRIGRALLRAIRANEAGVKAGVDAEFLHDLRVAVRRTRSALGQLGGVFPRDDTDRFEREFAALGRLTGPLRDLDVCLLGERRFRELVPPALAPGLDGFFEQLRTRRESALQEIREALDSPGYRRLLIDWRDFLAAAPAGPAAEEPVAVFARSRLDRRYQRVMRRGSAITAASPDRDLHRLRIQCKKLRYLLEFFASLFAADVIEDLVQRLKDLQDNLGEFNDLSLQRRRLCGALAALPPDGGQPTPAAAALACLAAALSARQGEVRADFAAAFASFAAGEARRRFAALGVSTPATRPAAGRTGNADPPG
ncbi:MAG TPA: CHAD domain-containing protein [Candidatus Krumholzibacteria bacterium]|nr:CHAD domain-containing protein [Candidatus Krumholzibacteria bacterium]HPD70499.1 CHAD domain-containing protein [Candidatus Krumholzibacteria bacterium]HRY39801.1 CHAD domain-containing protein [Candidatus Krumholzibacteria bacterium]